MKQQVTGHKEAGNALWFILLAVALLGALTAAISRSSDTAEQSGDIERYRIDASNLMRHTASVEAAVNNMLLRGTSENQISFDNAFVSGATYVNPNCSTSDCLVYDGAGGGVNYKTISSTILDAASSSEDTFTEWEYSGANDVDGVNTTAPDLIMYLSYVEQGLCRQINRLLKIPEISGDVPEDSNGFEADTPFIGSFASSATIDSMDGREVGCFNDSSGGGRNYTYYQVLIKR